ncbi:MAG: helix-turn-helix domain-containing protein [Anaerolineae bacterium]|nr:helix-turn-helix domain-containing protein [Anaerolineae bacterium]
MTDSEFGARLKQLRVAKAQKLERRKIPQREVAEKLNVTPGAYASWESGRTRPDINLLPAIADYFEVSIDFLLLHSTDAPTSLAFEPVPSKTNQVWSLRRQAQTDGERVGVEIWQRLLNGESLQKIASALKIHAQAELERHLRDVIYTDIIRIDHLPQNTELARQVQQTFGLREVIVVPVLAAGPHFIRNIFLGEAAREYFKNHVFEGMKVGLAGGYSVSRMVYSLRRGECRSIEVYPLAISPVIEAIGIDANSLVGALAYRHEGYNVQGYTLQYASPLDWKHTANIRQFAPTLRILAKAKSVDIAFMGLGVVGRRRSPIDLLGDLVDTLTPGLDMMRDRGAVGDILYHLVDARGRPVVPEISNLICSIELPDLQEMVQLGVPVIAIASRSEKRDIARAAIQAGYANVLIIDDKLAQALLES